MNLFKSVIIVQLFYAVAITLLIYSMPTGSLDYVNSFSDVAGESTLNDVSSEIQSSIEQQTNIPIIELGALLFYSGNILLDLVLNFAFAIPEMIGLLVRGIMILINLDGNLFVYVQLFTSAITFSLYFIGVMEMLLGIRSGSTNMI